MINKIRRIGIFGGSFDPIHLGHINSLLTVKKAFNLDKIKVIPAHVSPFKMGQTLSSVQDRIDMLHLGLKSYLDIFEIDLREIKRGGVSYSIQTVKEIASEEPLSELYLIMGMDQFNSFDKWEAFDQIVFFTNLIVTSRPGAPFPKTKADLPLGLSILVSHFNNEKIILTTGRSIDFIDLNDVEASSEFIRDSIRKGKGVSQLLNPRVESFINSRNLYKQSDQLKNKFSSRELANIVGQILYDKQGLDVKIFDLSQTSAPCEFAVIASGRSTKQASALSEALIKFIGQQLIIYPQSVEGVTEGRWILVDYGSVMVHIFYDFVRSEYKLEELWKSGIECETHFEPVKTAVSHENHFNDSVE